MSGEICYGNNCLPVNFLTTRWTVDQVQQVLNLFNAGYSPYKIARLVHRRTVDVYQIIYHRQEVVQIITFLTTPHGRVVCGVVEESVLYISTTWNCQTLFKAYELLSKGYSAYAVSRIVHKRYADVIAIRNHMEYFHQVLVDLMKKKPGVLKYDGYSVEFGLPGEYTVDQVCQMLISGDPLLKLWLTSDDLDAKWQLVVVYVVNGVYSFDLYRGCVLTYDLAHLLAEVLYDLIPAVVGASPVPESQCIHMNTFCDFEYLVNMIVSKYYNVIISGLGRANRIG